MSSIKSKSPPRWERFPRYPVGYGAKTNDTIDPKLKMKTRSQTMSSVSTCDGEGGEADQSSDHMDASPPAAEDG